MSTASAIQLTPAERPAYAHLFALADPQSTGMVSGSASVSFFALSGLPNPVLGSIWAIADADNNGFLGPAQFSAALRLIGHAQNGKVVTDDLIKDPGPMPTFKGITVPAHLSGGPAQTPSRSGSMMLQPQVTGQGGAFGTNDIKPEDRARYTRIFASAGPQSGLLDGEKAKEIFVKSKLPFEKLGAIWNLADTKGRGKLDLTDFIVGMYFIQSIMNGNLATIPTSLPPGLYERAAGAGNLPSSPGGTTALGAQNTGGSTGFVSRQLTGANHFGTPGSPMQSNVRSPPQSGNMLGAVQPQRTGSTFALSTAASSNWAVSAADKAKADRFFDGLDLAHKGVLEGQAAVPFFMQSGLNEATLAHVWDLSDITQSGSLTRDEFAVAMYLINLKITGSDLPQELPAAVVPPSLRGTNLPQAVNPKETDTQRDLFSLMDDDIELPVSTASAFAAPLTSTASRAAPTSGPFDDDFFGGTSTPKTASATPAAGTLSPTMTGASSMSGQTGSRSLPFGDPSAEAANRRLALENTQKSLSTLETKKDDLEKIVSNDANSITDLKTRLETVRMRHQTESEAVKALTDRQASQALELKKLREESVREESEYSRLKAEKDEIEQSLMKDREDVREMKRLVGERTKQKEELKLELEKLKKEARMQKGLVAIGKKQLSQADGEVAAVQQDVQHVKAGEVAEEHGEVAMSPETEASRDATAAAAPSSVLSPAASVRSNNPFDRLPTHTGAAAAAGAAAGLAAATGLHTAAAHDDESREHATEATHDDDPFGARQASTHGAATLPSPTAVAAKPEAAFDDSFVQMGSLTSNNAGVTARAAENTNQAFDDAFADFDVPSTEGQGLDGAKETEAVTSAVPGSFSAIADQAAISAPAIPASVEEREAHPSAVEPETSLAGQNAEVVPPAAPLGTSSDNITDVEDDDSSDEEEGPEDVENSAKRHADSPDELGEGKLTDATTVTAAQPPAETALQAADRFPELDEETPTSKAPIAATSALQQPQGAANVGNTYNISSGADLPETGADAFHDAFSDTPTSREGAEAGAGSGFMTLTGHERYTTALDEGDASQGRSSSPSKVRRAPPPAPVRGSTITSNGVPSNINAGPFSSINSTVPSTAPPAVAMDDFDAAFEDLGPSTNASAAVPISSPATMPGFDDAFGDADGFSFVPSFSNQSMHPPAASSAAQAGAFDSFDAAFEPAAPTSATSRSPAAPTAKSASQEGSGFSFEDAFLPAEISSAAPPTSSNLAPSLPARPQESGPSAGGGTGALPDDAAPVRQLCAMGFSRADVIKSLEKSNYRTDKALERLLAQS